MLFGLLLAPLQAASQVLEPPPRSIDGLFGGRRPVDPTRAQQELTLTFDMLGGFDDVIVPEGRGTPTNPYLPRRSGLTGFASGTARYWRGTNASFVEGSGRIHATGYSELVSDALVGGTGRLRMGAGATGRTRISVAATGDYRPSFAFEGFGPIAEQVETGTLPETDPTAGISELRSFTTRMNGTVERHWTRRNRTALSYDFTDRDFTGGGAQDSVRHEAGVRHSWAFLRTTSLRLAYRSSEQTIAAGDYDRPLRTHGADMGVEWRKRLSPSRKVALELGGGASRVRTVSVLDNRALNYTLPSAYGSVRFDVARTWAVSADARRDITVLEGLSNQGFVNHAGALHGGGRLSERLALALSVAYSQADAPRGEPGSFQTVNATVQFDYSVTTWCSMVTSYTYYDHLLRGVTGIPQGFPRRLERNSVRLGVTFWLPLYGSFPPDRGRTAREAL